MKKIKILTDTCCDLSKDLRDKYNIDYFQHTILFKDKWYPASLDWDEGVSYDEFFSWMKEGDNLVKTGHVTPDLFATFFKKYMDEYDIIFIASSSAQTAVAMTGRMVAEDFMKENPSVRIAVIDSVRSTCCLGMMCVDAAKMAEEGVPFDEIVTKITSTRNNYNEFATVGSLEWLRRSGRVKAPSAFFGNLFGVKPIMIADRNGAQTPIKKVKGRKKALEEIVTLLSDSIDDSSDVWILDGDCSEEDISYIKELVNEKIPGRNIIIQKIGPILGASCGPETTGVFAKGKEVTYASED